MLKTRAGFGFGVAAMLMMTLVSGAFSFDEQPLAVKAMTFNVRYPAPKDLLQKSWDVRKDLVVGMVNKHAPDFLGTQEIVAEYLPFLEEQLPGYAHIGRFRKGDGDRFDECSKIFYRTERWEVVEGDTGSFQLSETPDVVGSRDWTSMARVTTWARFREKTSGHTLYVYNTHWDHVSGRDESSLLCAERIASRNVPEDPVIFMGDFNQRQGEKSIRHLLGEHVFEEAPPIAMADTDPEVKKIDHIFVMPADTKVVEGGVIKKRFDVEGYQQVRPSDHDPTLAVLEFRPSAASAGLRSGPMVGHTTHTSCWIWAHAGEGRHVELSYRPARSDGEDWKTLTLPPRPERKSSSLAALNGLEPQTTYRYRIDVGGQRAAKGQFTTAPPPNRAAKFSYVITSCMDFKLYPEQPAWDAVLAQKPDFHLLIGDNVYANSTDREVLWRFHLKQRSIPNFAELLATVPSYATWDDHDYGPNDAHGMTPGKENSLEAFKDLWANPSYGEKELPGVFYSYCWGNVQFIVLDDRYYRTDERSENTPGKTQFGEAQRDWLFRQLKSTRAPFKVVVTGYDIMGARYPEEIGIIARFVREHQIYGVLFHSGDIHRNEYKQQEHGMGYPVVQITSSGIAKNDNRPWAMVDVDTTLDDPALTARFFTREALDTTKELRLSMLTPQGVSDLILNSPVGGERLVAGCTHTIRWTRVGQGIDEVKLEYNAGAGWNTIASSAPNTGMYAWTVPTKISAHVRVRVSSEDGAHRDESREAFEIVRAR